MTISKYSFGIGDRFAHEGVNLLKALVSAEKRFGVHFTPVWNKSNREHTIIGTEPADVRDEVTAAVMAAGYYGEYHVDADHIGLGNVDWFMDASDFFTLDVADFTGKPAAKAAVKETPLDILSVDILAGWQYLGEISGKTASEDIIDDIFSRFCVGK